MKKIIFLILAALLPSLVYALDNNFYFTVPPNGERCLNFDIPRDFTTYAEGRYQINLTSDLTSNIHFIDTYASSKNRIDVPICFSAKNKNESDFGYYKFFLKSKDKLKTISGGICVSSLDDVDIINKKGEPCDLMNNHNDLFSASLSPEVLYLEPGKTKNITLKLSSQEDIDVEVRPQTSLNTDKTPKIIRLEKGKIQFVPFSVSSPDRGTYNFSVLLNAIINRDYCKFPFCELEVQNEVLVDGITRTGWDFEVFPRTASTTRLEQTEFAVTVTNYDDEKTFTVDARLESGLLTDFQQTTFSLKKDETRNIIIKVTPESLTNKMYTINFIVKSDREETETVFFTVGEYTTDFCRRFPKLCEGSTPPNLGGCKIGGTNIINASCAVNQSNTVFQNQTHTNPPEPSEGINPIPIIIIILIFALVLVYFVFKKKKVSEIEVE